MLGCSGVVPSLVGFISHHPVIMFDASVLSVGAVGGQFFIYSMVKDFGALAFAATMNVRQVASIIVSYIVYSKPITGLQILGLVMVFGALFYKSIIGIFASRDQQRAEKEETK